MNEAKIAYFSMEIALENEMPTYSGGLGVLAGDTLRSASSMKLPMVGMTLLHRKGYFHQKLNEFGDQKEESVVWPIEKYLEPLPPKISVKIEGREVFLKVWRYLLQGKMPIPVYFLDADLPENSEWDRKLTDHLYGGDQHYRLCQEIILGIGGIRMLRALGYQHLERYHMNEGHSSFLIVELLEETAKKSGREIVTDEDITSIRQQCVFTTHTPVSAAHDQFPLEMVKNALGERPLFERKDVFCCEGVVNMSFLALNLSHYINGVAKKHGETAQLMFARYSIDSITNGVHPPTWVCPSFQTLFDRYIPGWKEDNFSLRYALNLPAKEIWESHLFAKKELLNLVKRQTGVALEEETFTIGFARRATGYKRADLLFQDIERLKRIAREKGRMQVIYGGKAHPQDGEGKEIIRKIFQAKKILGNDVTVVYLENYEMSLAKYFISGVDLWLNTPQIPFEASGTSGMKAALNGIPSLSVLDGWWVEGYIEGITGWSIQDAQSLLEKLESQILSLYYKNKERYIDVMRHCIALNGSFFNTQRMLQQYVVNAYFL